VAITIETATTIDGILQQLFKFDLPSTKRLQLKQETASKLKPFPSSLAAIKKD